MNHTISGLRGGARRVPQVQAAQQTTKAATPIFRMATIAAVAGLVVLHPDPFKTVAAYGANVLQTLVRGH